MSENAAEILEHVRAIAREQREDGSECMVDFPPELNGSGSITEQMLYQEINRLWDALGVPSPYAKT